MTFSKTMSVMSVILKRLFLFKRHTKMYSHHRNSFLQLEIPSINPRLINRAVDKAMENETDCYNTEPSYLRLCSEQPCIPIDGVDSTRCDKPFGKWALPKLYKELYSSSLETQIKAVNTVGDMVHDPEQAFEAIRFGFVKRLVDLLENGGNLNDGFKERILLALKTMAGHALGREAMMDNKKLMPSLLRLLEENENIRCKAAALLRELTNNYMGCCALIEQGFVRFVVNHALFEVPHIAIILLDALEKLLSEVEGQELGFNTDALEKLVSLLEHENEEVVARAARCLMHLVSNQQGKDLSVELQLLQKLNDLLHSNNRDVYTAAASVIMFATHTVKSKHDAVKTTDLPQRLAKLTGDYNNPAVQMFAIKALTNMCEHPTIRKMFLEYYLDRMRNIVTKGSEELERYKDTLLKVIEWKPWIG